MWSLSESCADNTQGNEGPQGHGYFVIKPAEPNKGAISSVRQVLNNVMKITNNYNVSMTKILKDSQHIKKK